MPDIPRLLRWFLLAFVLIILPSAPRPADAAELRVMTFNIWVGGDAGKQPISQTAEVIRAAYPSDHRAVVATVEIK